MDGRRVAGAGVQVGGVGRAVRVAFSSLIRLAHVLLLQRSTKIITDKDGRGIVFFVGQPLCAHGGKWADVAKAAAETMASVREEGFIAAALPPAFQSHRRGDFVAIAVGVSHGGGQTAPGTLVHAVERQALINRLLADSAIKRIAGYQSSMCALSFYAPKLYAHFCHRLLWVYEHDNNLQRNFAESIFPAASFNLGPSTVSLEHTDAGNVGYGLCALVALGEFDYRAGGHLVLFDLGLMVQFPPGAVVLLPSGVLRHGNTPIQSNEERYSIAQYCAGGLLRWHRYGLRTASAATKGAGKAKAKAIMGALNGKHDDRVREALALFSRVDELETDRTTAFTNFHRFLTQPLPEDVKI
ncbi:hypothetical protein BDN72DRAFT_779221 [Pluteus cervinus]|uniref:Uncharacterized protein n=1 Tax=Pluteus cervinus TaxID=181527 RepID=A0ACD3A4I5_9AGAR|nr:hypothetical protein BDN72DRAFT_779221 [Pluteus cervinus]